MASQREKMLLLASSPPGGRLVGEIILRDLARYYGAERTHFIAIVPAHQQRTAEFSDDEILVRMLESGKVYGERRRPDKWGAPGAFLRFLAGFRPEVSRLVREIASEAEAAGARRIFAVLDSPLMMAVAHRAAKACALPLVSLIWDPPDYLARFYRFDRWSRRLLLREFRASLADSTRVAVVSEAMQKEYAAWTRAPIHLLRHGVAPVPEGFTDTDLPEDAWVIGFAGSMYSDCAWRSFLAALDAVGWQLGGRPVRLRLLTSKIEVSGRQGAFVEFLGLRAPEQVQGLLAACHLTYMPQPFVPHLRDLCRYAFPTKLGNYLSLGRPVFVHSPPDSALSAFYSDHPVGAIVNSLEAADIIHALELLLGSDISYSAACRQARETAHLHFTESTFHASIDRVLGDVKDLPDSGGVGEVGFERGGNA